MNRRPLRLVFVGTLSEPGGAASHFISLVSAMAAAGHQVAVLAARGSGVWRTLERNESIELHAAEFTRKFDTDAMRTLRQVVREVKPHHIVGVFERDYWGTAVVAAQNRVPLTLFLHHAGLKRSSRLALRWVRRHFVVPSHDLRNWIISRGASASRTSVLHNPIDTEYFQQNPEMRAAQRAQFCLSDNDVLVGFVGRIETNKGVIPLAEALTKAMTDNHNLRALWIGFGRRETDIDAIAQRSPFANRHIRLPWTDDMLPYYSAMDIVALPSTGRESFGRVLAEAESCGIPVLGSDIGGIAEAMDAGHSGQLVAPGDVDAWANAIGELATNPERRAQMGVAGRKYVRAAFDSAVIARGFEELLHARSSK
ncbi:MAG: glycosyltransferase family 4 protein [Gemmatimonadaceae bacterium]